MESFPRNCARAAVPFFCVHFFLALPCLFVYKKMQAGDKAGTLPPALTQATETPMAQAESITTAIRELMSRGRPLKSTSPVRAAHTEFVAALAGNAPHPIRPDANWEVLEDRADHLEKTIAALHVYVSAIIAAPAQDIPASTLDRRYVDGLFQQFSADVLGAIRDAAAEMRLRENWRGL